MKNFFKVTINDLFFAKKDCVFNRLTKLYQFNFHRSVISRYILIITGNHAISQTKTADSSISKIKLKGIIFLCIGNCIIRILQIQQPVLSKNSKQ